MTSKEQQIAAYARRYAELESAGRTLKTLPGPSRRPAPERHVFRRETLPGGWYLSMTVLAGETIRLQTGDKPSAVALVAWRRDDPSERLNFADTVKIQWTTVLEKGRLIFSDMGRVMFSIIEDSSGFHDALVGGSTAASNAARYGEGYRNTRDNLTLAALKLGLGPRDIPPCLTFFAPVRVDANGRFAWHAEGWAGGHYVDLRAEMDIWIALSNCPHPLDPAPNYDPTPVEILKFEPVQTGGDDLCRTASDEARRGFDNLEAFAV